MVSNPFAEHIALAVESVSDGRSVTTLCIAPEHLNPHGVMHGAVAFALADTGMGAAVYTRLKPGQSCATIELKINFLATARGGTLRCESEVLRMGRSVAYLESRVECDGVLVATVSGHYAVFAPRG